MIRRAGLAGALLALATGACGVPTDDNPRAIPQDRVPFGLLEPTLTSTTAVPAPPGSTAVTVFLVAGDRLTPVRRNVTLPLDAEKLLGALLAGPTPEEAARAVRTAVAPAGDLTVSGPSGGNARVELPAAFFTRSPGEQVLALAQVVYTLTTLPGVDNLVFTMSGRAVDVPADDGILRSGAVRRSDFASVAHL